MTLSVEEALQHIQHALGGDPASELTCRRILNEAGDLLVSSHRWGWLERPEIKLAARAPITLTAATWDDATLTLTEVGAFAAYTFLAGDGLEITGGTGATLGFYEILSRASADAITLRTSIGVAADAQTDITAQIDLPGMALPADFSDIVAVSNYDLRLTTYKHIIELRSGDAHLSPWGYLGAITYGAAGATGGAPTPILTLWPAPSVADVDAVRMVYRAGWTEIDDDQELVSVPRWIERLYLRFVKAVALGYENDEPDLPTVQARVAEVVESQDFRAAVERDGAVQTDYGPIRGGAAEYVSMDYWPRTSSIGPPS